jgi:peptidoglycan/LPS O-acetylase OafA/YrhL
VARFRVGDPLRAVAALSVVIFHLGALAVVAVRAPAAASFEHSWLGHFWLSLDFGVAIFFVLSGYLIGRPFLRWLLADGDRPSPLPYLRNRVLRIVPAFWVAAALTICLLGRSGASSTQLLAIFGFAQTYHYSPAADHIVQAWSLSVEMGFYVLLPIAALAGALLLRRASRRLRTTVVVATVTVVAGASIAARLAGSHTALHETSLPTVLFAFAPGLLLATFEVVAAFRLASWRRARTFSLSLVTLGLVTFAAACALQDFSRAWQYLLYDAAAGLILAAALTLQWAHGDAWRALDNRVLHWLGERSYSIFLLHVLVIVEVGRLVGTAPTVGANLLRWGLIATPATVALAALSFALVERPFLRLRGPWRSGAATRAGGYDWAQRTRR